MLHHHVILNHEGHEDHEGEGRGPQPYLRGLRGPRGSIRGRNPIFVLLQLVLNPLTDTCYNSILHGTRAAEFQVQRTAFSSPVQEALQHGQQVLIQEEGQMSVVIPDGVLQAANLSEAELLQELAILLFQQNRLTLAQASHLAQLDRIAFQQVLASRSISIHYDVNDFEEDLHTLRRLGQL